MSIPDQITLAGITIDIVDVPGLAEQRKLLGEAQYNQQRIIIDKGAASQDIIEQCYIHEVVHWVLYIMNEDNHRNDEKFVDVFAHFMHQANKSAVYKEPV